MAEVVGTIAATSQLAETALKLRKLYAEIRNAPDDLRALLEEVAILADLLGDVQQSSNGQPAGDQRVWQRCFTLLQNSADAMKQLVTDLNQILTSHRRTGAIRLYLRKDESNKCKEKLERVKMTMILAQQYYTHSILTQHILSGIHTLAITQQAVAHASPTTTLQVVKPEPDDRLRTTSDYADIDTKVTQPPARIKILRQASSYNIRLPNWIWTKGLQVLLERSNSSWGLTVRPYNRISSDSEIIGAIGDNDCHKMNALFDSRQASPFDLVGNLGRNLLEHAIALGSYDACSLLLGYKLDPFMSEGQTVFYIRWHYSYSSNKNRSRSISARYDEFRENIFKEILFGPHAVLEANEHDLVHISQLFDAKNMSLILRSVVPTYTTLGRLFRARLAVQTLSEDHEMVQLLLGPGLNLLEAFALLSETGSNVNHCDLWGNAVQRVSPTQKVNEHSGWYTILSEIIAFESRPTHRFRYRSKLYQPILSAMPDTLGCSLFVMRDWSRYFTETVRKVLRLISDLGGDLSQYGPAEKSSLEGLSFVTRVLTRKRGLYKASHLKRFEVRHLVYGADVDDWQIFVVEVEPCNDCYFPTSYYCSKHIQGKFGNAEYEMAGAFWDWVENPELFAIPGAYIPYQDDSQQSDEERCYYWTTPTTSPG